MKGSRPVKLISKNTRRVNNQLHDSSEVGGSTWLHAGETSEGWFENAPDKKMKAKNQVSDDKGNKSTRKSTPPRSLSSATESTLRSLHILGKFILQFTTKLLIRSAIYIIVHLSKNPRKALPICVTCLILFLISKNKPRSLPDNTPPEYAVMHSTFHENNTLLQENVSVATLHTAPFALKETVEKEERERLELLSRLNDEMSQPSAPKDDSYHTETTAHDESKQELLKLLGSLIAQANKAQQLQIKSSAGDVEEGSLKNDLQEMFISIPNASDTVNNTVTNSSGSFIIMNETVPAFSETNMSDARTEIMLSNQSSSSMDAISLPKVFTRLANIGEPHKNTKGILRRPKNIPYFWYIPLGIYEYCVGQMMRGNPIISSFLIHIFLFFFDSPPPSKWTKLAECF
jgi:hypothetical protein